MIPTLLPIEQYANDSRTTIVLRGTIRYFSTALAHELVFVITFIVSQYSFVAKEYCDTITISIITSLLR